MTVIKDADVINAGIDESLSMVNISQTDVYEGEQALPQEPENPKRIKIGEYPLEEGLHPPTETLTQVDSDTSYVYEYDALTDADFQQDEVIGDSYNEYDGANDTTQTKKSRTSIKIFIAVLSTTIILVLLTSFVLLNTWYGKRLYMYTAVNGIDMSNLTAQEAYDALAQSIDDYFLEITDKDGAVTHLTKEEAGLFIPRDRVVAAVNDIISNQHWTAFFTEKYYEIDKLGEIDNDILNSSLDKSEIFNPKESVPSQNAYIIFDEELKKFVIVPDVLGNIMEESFKDTIAEKLIHYETALNLLDEGLYKQADIVKDNETLVHNLNLYNAYIPGDYTVDMTEGLETLAVSDYYNWLTPNYVETDEDVNSLIPEINIENPFSVDSEKISEYVSELNKKYTTFGSYRDFKTTSGSVIKITKGDYGWWLDRKKTAEIIHNALLDKNNKEPICAAYFQKAAQRGENDYGNSYVEINLSSQQLWLYINGEPILSSPIVTGRPSTGHATPPGIYSMTYKERNATLRGPGYATPVSYWMPFNRDVGLHDATWQSAFGGNRYITYGSHGCVNLPYNIAKEIYSYVDKEFPVILYH